MSFENLDLIILSETDALAVNGGRRDRRDDQGTTNDIHQYGEVNIVVTGNDDLVVINLGSSKGRRGGLE